MVITRASPYPNNSSRHKSSLRSNSGSINSKKKLISEESKKEEEATAELGMTMILEAITKEEEEEMEEYMREERELLEREEEERKMNLLLEKRMKEKEKRGSSLLHFATRTRMSSSSETKTKSGLFNPETKTFHRDGERKNSAVTLTPLSPHGATDSDSHDPPPPPSLVVVYDLLLASITFFRTHFLALWKTFSRFGCLKIETFINKEFCSNTEKMVAVNQTTKEMLKKGFLREFFEKRLLPWLESCKETRDAMIERVKKESIDGKGDGAFLLFKVNIFVSKMERVKDTRFQNSERFIFSCGSTVEAYLMNPKKTNTPDIMLDVNTNKQEEVSLSQKELDLSLLSPSPCDNMDIESSSPSPSSFNEKTLKSSSKHHNQSNNTTIKETIYYDHNNNSRTEENNHHQKKMKEKEEKETMCLTEKKQLKKIAIEDYEMKRKVFTKKRLWSEEENTEGIFSDIPKKKKKTEESSSSDLTNELNPDFFEKVTTQSMHQSQTTTTPSPPPVDKTQFLTVDEAHLFLAGLSSRVSASRSNSQKYFSSDQDEDYLGSDPYTTQRMPEDIDFEEFNRQYSNEREN